MILLSAVVAHAIVVKVQGVQRADVKAAPAMRVAPNASTFTIDSIKNWSGEGSNSAVMVIQWSDDQSDNKAWAFGYHFDGTSTGAQMLETIVKNNPQLYSITQTSGYGLVIGGLGWDTDGNGLRLTNGTDTIEANEYGQFSGSGYNFDNMKPVDANDLWNSGWYSSYWSYWIGTSASSLGYSGVGATGRKVTDGCWDMWKISTATSDGKLVSAPSLIPDDAVRRFTIDGVCYELLTYSKGRKTVQMVKPFNGSTYKGTITVPAQFTYKDLTYDVVAVADSACYNATGLTTLSLPGTITKVGSYAFAHAGIATVNLENVKSLGTGAFAGSSLTAVKLPTLVTQVPASAFAGCDKLASVDLNAATTIGTKAFAGCSSLKTVNFGKAVTAIADSAFSGAALTTVSCESTKPATCTGAPFDSTTLASATLTVPAGYSDLYKQAAVWKDFAHVAETAVTPLVGYSFFNQGLRYTITAYSNEAREVKVTYPDADELKNRTSQYTGHIVVPDTALFQNEPYKVTAIGDSAFYYSTITSIELPKTTLLSIGTSAFAQCESLATIAIPSTVEHIGSFTFFRCSSLASATLPQALKQVPNAMFYYASKLASIELPATVNEIGEQAFNGTALTQIEVPAGVKRIESYTFANCSKLTQVKLSDQTTYIGSYAFNGDRLLAQMQLPEAVDTIMGGAFNNCSVLPVALGSKVKYIGSNAFAYCKAITTITIPQGVQELYSGTFNGCTGLTAVNGIERYSKIPSNFFAGCTALDSVSLPSAKIIDSNAFKGCTSLKAVVAGNNLTTVNTSAFNGCTALSNVQLGDSLTTLGSSAFYGCKALTHVNLGEKLTTVSSSLFYNCTSLANVVLPPTVTSVSSSAFYGCTNAHVWVTSAKVGTASNYSFKLSTTQYVPLTVLTGLRDTYQAATGWKLSEITELAVDSLNNELTQSVIGNTTAQLTLKPALSYKTQAPASFIKYNDAHLLAGVKTAVVEYAKAGQRLAPAMREAGQTVTTTTDSVTAELDADGQYTASIANLDEGSDYDYRLVLTLADGNKYYGQWQQFTTTIATGVNEAQLASGLTIGTSGAITVEGARTVKVYDLQGRLVSSQPTAHVAPGIYVVVADGKAFKVLVK